TSSSSHAVPLDCFLLDLGASDLGASALGASAFLESFLELLGASSFLSPAGAAAAFSFLGSAAALSLSLPASLSAGLSCLSPFSFLLPLSAFFSDLGASFFASPAGLSAGCRTKPQPFFDPQRSLSTGPCQRPWASPSSCRRPSCRQQAANTDTHGKTQ